MRSTRFISIAAVVGAAFLVGFGTNQAGADSRTFSFFSGTHSAEADFLLTGTDLAVTLLNLSSSPVNDGPDVLSGLFFDTSTTAGHGLTPLSASLNGSSVHFGAIVNNVGEGWQYKSGVSAQGKNSGISAAGLGIFGPDGNFGNGSPGVTVDGLDYSILGTGSLAGANASVTGHGPLIQNSVLFHLTAGASFSLNDLANDVVFQYGTATDEFHGNSVPEPIFYQLGALLGLGGIGMLRMRRKEASKA